MHISISQTWKDAITEAVARHGTLTLATWLHVHVGMMQALEQMMQEMKHAENAQGQAAARPVSRVSACSLEVQGFVCNALGIVVYMLVKVNKGATFFEC